jgi:hypothetical protein
MVRGEVEYLPITSFVHVLEKVLARGDSDATLHVDVSIVPLSKVWVVRENPTVVHHLGARHHRGPTISWTPSLVNRL